MSFESTNDRLNALLIEIYRSLTQYASESWPWTTDGAEELAQAVKSLGQRQKQDVKRIADFLHDRDDRVDVGNYPDYSSLHYVALSYLVQKLQENQKQIVRDLELAQQQIADDAEVKTLLNEITASQKDGLKELEAVSLAQPAANRIG